MESHLGILYTEYLSGRVALCIRVSEYVCWGLYVYLPAAPAQVGHTAPCVLGHCCTHRAALRVHAAVLGCLQAAVIPCTPLCCEWDSNSQEITGFTLLKGTSKGVRQQALYAMNPATLSTTDKNKIYSPICPYRGCRSNSSNFTEPPV